MALSFEGVEEQRLKRSVEGSILYRTVFILEVEVHVSSFDVVLNAVHIL